MVMGKLRKAGPGLSETLSRKALRSLLSELFPIGKPLMRSTWSRIVWNPTFAVDFAEVFNTIKSCKKTDSAPGPDGLKYSVWKKAPGIVFAKLAECFSLCLERGIYPQSWKVADLILIPKGGHTVQIPKARPICLLDTVGKIFEKILCGRINEWLDNNPRHSLSNRQFGFRKRRSTNDALLLVRKLITTATGSGFMVLAISLDISNAFNSIPFTQIRKALYRKRVPDYLRRIIVSYLSNRRVRYRDHNGVWSYKEVLAGVPQGSVLGPLLWNIAYDPVLRTLLQGRNDIVCFADDTLILLAAKSMNLLNEYVYTDFHRVLKVIKEIGLKLSENKTDIMLFGGRNRDLPIIKVGTASIRVTRSMKYLGVILDSRWKFVLHFAYVRDKALRITRALERLMPNLKGPAQNKRRLYAEVILSILLYASPLWCISMTKSSKRRNSFRAILRRLCVRLVCAYRTTSTDAAMLLASVPPIHLMAENRSWCFTRIRESMGDGTYSVDLVNSIKQEEKNALIRRWKDYLVGKVVYGRYTVDAILPHFDKWMYRGFGQLNFHITQLLTAHGCFAVFLHKIGKRGSPLCTHCDEGIPDSSLHTLFQCAAWARERAVLFEIFGPITTLSEFIDGMLTSQESWTAACSFVDLVMTEKEDREREEERRGVDFPSQAGGLMDWDSDLDL